jgi:protein-disulfide isomerase
VSTKAWIIFAIVTVGFLGGLLFLNQQDKIDVSKVDDSKIVSASAANGNIADHVYGSRDQKVVLIEYGDFQCPACASAFPVLKEVKEKFKADLTFIFRNNPLTAIHPNARIGSAAAEAAGLQDKFWEMHDLLFQNQNAWSQASIDKRAQLFEEYAKTVGVKDLNKFKQDLGSKEVTAKIDFDLALGKKIPVQGTPTITLNGEKVENETWASVDKLTKAVEEAIKKTK